MQSLACLSDDVLLRDLHVIVGSHRRVTAELILHLGEMDARRLHVEKGFSSLFSYCVERLCFSEDEACRRIEAARLASQFPAIYPFLEAGTVSLTVLGLLKPHLTRDNHRALLTGVSAASVRQAKEWLAVRFPRPDVPWSIRKEATRCPAPASRPAPISQPAPTRVAPVELPSEDCCVALPALARATPAGSMSEACSLAVVPASPRAMCSLAAPPAPARPTRARVEPLSQDRFLVKFTASRPMRDKLELASDLLSHANPRRDLAVVLERAVDLLIAELEKERQGRTSRPEKKLRAAKATHITPAARREVVGSDGWQCSFVAGDGQRCRARGFLEFDHSAPGEVWPERKEMAA